MWFSLQRPFDWLHNLCSKFVDTWLIAAQSLKTRGQRKSRPVFSVVTHKVKVFELWAAKSQEPINFKFRLCNQSKGLCKLNHMIYNFPELQQNCKIYPSIQSEFQFWISSVQNMMNFNLIHVKLISIERLDQTVSFWATCALITIDLCL